VTDLKIDLYMLADILSSLKLRRFSLLHLFSHHFSRQAVLR